MKTVVDNINEIVIKKSKFIAIVYNISSIDVIENKLLEVSNKYNDATHICYAYIINSHEKCSDDGEPSGTAGLPILNVLKKENLNNVLCIVVRYFGGIKLGTGGLIRAYSNCCKKTIISKNLQKGYFVKIKFKYEYIKDIDYLLKNSTILEKSFNSMPTYSFKIVADDFNKIQIKLDRIAKIIITEDIYM